MSSEKYIGLDVHQATISVAVMDSQGKVVMESILETKASTLLEFFAGLRGSLFVTFEEGTWAAWLYDLLKPHVTEVLVCNPRKIPLLKQGNKSDKIDARKLAERLRLHDLKPVYHGETGIRMLRELARSYLTVVKDLSRVMNRLKALYRSWAIPCAGRDVYYRRHRSAWLDKAFSQACALYSPRDRGWSRFSRRHILPVKRIRECYPSPPFRYRLLCQSEYPRLKASNVWRNHLRRTGRQLRRIGNVAGLWRNALPARRFRQSIGGAQGRAGGREDPLVPHSAAARCNRRRP